MLKFVNIAVYDRVEHTRQFDDVATFEGTGSGRHEVEISLGEIASIKECLGQESDARFRPVCLNDFFILKTVGGVEYLIDLASRDAIKLAANKI